MHCQMLTRTLWSPRATVHARVGVVPEQGDGQGGRPRPGSLSGADLIGLGVAIALALVLPAAIGVGIDALSHSSPVGFLIGLAVGIVGACTTAFMQFRRYL
jgi:Putative F0F1-ATPase subunit Ca2+/Mg2+ transporter